LEPPGEAGSTRPSARPLAAREAAGARRRAAWLFGSILVSALVLRLVFALRKGLVLDEFHSYFHATRPTWAAFLETLRRDNHPPAAFLAIRAARALFGDSELALRLPALIFGLFELVLVARIARRCGGRPWLAMALLAVSSLHIDCSSEVRMYSLLGLAVTGVVEALSAILDRDPAAPAVGVQARCALWIAVGLHAHYFFLQYLFWIACAVLFASRVPAVRARTRALLLPTLVAGATALPWYLTGFLEQLGSGLPPGGDNNTPEGLVEAFVHLLFLNVRLGGPVLRLVFIGCGVLACLLGAVSWCGPLRRGSPQTGALVLVLGVVAFAVPVLSDALTAVYPRAGFTWHYVLPSAAALASLIACDPVQDRWRRAGVGLVLGSASLLAVLNTVSPGTQQYPAAVRTVLERYRPGDAIVSIEWQPELFPQGQPWDYYAPRLADGEPPARLALSGWYPAHPRELFEAERVWLLRTSLPADQPLVRSLTDRFREQWKRGFGFGIDLTLFVR